MTETALPPTSFTHRQIMIVLAGLLTGMALAGLDQTIVDTALPTIVGDLGGINHLSWVVTAYLLTSTVSTPIYGKLSDIYGRRRLFQAAIVIFLIGSMLCGIAQNMPQLIGFRAVQGIGGGGLIAMAFAIIADVVPPRERGRYTGYIVSVFAVTSVIGPVLGGLFVDHLSWRWIFYVNVPLGILSLIVTTRVLNLTFVVHKRRIDYEGAALLVVGVTCLLLALVWGGDQYPWGSNQIVGLGVIGFAIMTVFVLWEQYKAVDPMVPLRLFGNSIVRTGAVLSFLLSVTQYGGIVFLPIFLQIVGGRTATNSGLNLLPLMLGLLVASTISGRRIATTGRYKRYPIIGFSLVAIVLVLFSTMDASTGVALTSLYMAIFGAGLGMSSPVITTAVQNAVDTRDIGTATSGNVFFRNLGGAFGVAIFGSLLNNRLAHELAKRLPEGTVDPSSFLHSPAAIRALPAEIRVAVTDAVQHAVTSVFLWAAPIAVLGVVFALLFREIPLRQHSAIQAPGEADAGDVDNEIAMGAAHLH